jgi:hypothetical protein
VLPVKTAETNMNYGPPAGLDGEIGDLPCARLTEHGHRGIYSVWELTDHERECIANGYNIRLGIIGMEPIPPVSLGVTHLQNAAETTTEVGAAGA